MNNFKLKTPEDYARINFCRYQEVAKRNEGVSDVFFMAVYQPILPVLSPNGFIVSNGVISIEEYQKRYDEEWKRLELEKEIQHETIN
jgi:hypothetical protein